MEKEAGYSILIAEGSKQYMPEWKDRIDRMGIFSSFELCFSGREAIETALRVKPDLVICSLFIQHVDGLGVASKLREAIPDTAVVITCSLDNNGLIEKCFSNGADMVLIKPVKYDIFDNKIRELLEDRRRCHGTVLKRDKLESELEKEITWEMQHIGFRAGVKGYSFVRYAILLNIMSDRHLSVMHDVYPEVARRFNTNKSCVERNIRSAIEGAWSHGSVSYIEKVFGFSVDADRGKPTNSAFIATVAERVKFKYGL